ncbi:hypothetical protein OHB93_12095 [Microbacterium sp. No. 7]|uniref:hypothetical protein n=1 Tax=Microbacterium sp. No. 7 TaxID=1714373 RepID=UPI0030091228
MGETMVAERLEPAPEKKRGEPRSRALLIAAIAVGAIAVVVAGWQIAAWTALGAVRIVYDARPVACEGAEVTLDPPGASDEFLSDGGFAGDETFYSPVVGVEPGMTCGVRFFVVNDGWSEVDARAVALPGMQEEFVSLIRPTMVNPNGQMRLADTDDAAVFAIEGMPVPAGDQQSFTVILEANAEDAGGYDQCSGFMPRPPRVTVSALGVERTVASPEDSGIWYSDGARSDCD